MASLIRGSFAVALRKLGLPAWETVMIGDTPCDVEAGLEAGTAAAGILTGGFAQEALRGAGCYAVSEDLHGLLPDLQRGGPAATPGAATASTSQLKRA
jgi:phosphoglycolate phosphatase-like HAD superfamily hydrolase